MAKAEKVKYAISRRRLNVIVAAVVLFVICLSFVDRYFGGGFREGVLLRVPRAVGAEKYHLKTFKVVKIVDGDTLDIDIADGKYDTTRVRLLGVDTPETKKAGVEIMYYGPEATAFTSSAALGKEVTIVIDTVSDVRDRYGRLLAYVRLEDGSFLNEELIKRGYGYGDVRFAHSRYDKFMELSRQAIESKAGLWQEVKRDQLPRWLQRERPALLAK